MEITAAVVKELREKTGAGMMDCKKALGETGGDLDKAIDYLRQKGLAAAAKKADRVATDGAVAAYYYDFGDGQNSGWVQNATVTHAYATAGTYQVKVRVRDSAGAESTDAMSTVTVAAAAPAESGSSTLLIVVVATAAVGLGAMMFLLMRKKAAAPPPPAEPPKAP